MICFLLDPDQTTECGRDYLTVNDDGVVVNGRDISQGGFVLKIYCPCTQMWIKS